MPHSLRSTFCRSHPHHAHFPHACTSHHGFVERLPLLHGPCCAGRPRGCAMRASCGRETSVVPQICAQGYRRRTCILNRCACLQSRVASSLMCSIAFTRARKGVAVCEGACSKMVPLTCVVARHAGGATRPILQRKLQLRRGLHRAQLRVLRRRQPLPHRGEVRWLWLAGASRTLHTFTNATCRSICGLPCATSDECGGECQVCAQGGRYRGYCVPSGNNGTCGVACGGALC